MQRRLSAGGTKLAPAIAGRSPFGQIKPSEAVTVVVGYSTNGKNMANNTAFR
jgi:hypothetical protein